jgi:hypothetical protein
MLSGCLLRSAIFHLCENGINRLSFNRAVVTAVGYDTVTTQANKGEACVQATLNDEAYTNKCYSY